eukprot:CAMPEP_0173190736 /NCGR_PEP_ID=MMETSP1141-20130122/12505_1 /TAXON_ID=483371 /ORGANISM="non described non described, Strain CCMP2298" /LENGTH=59 /DNA_ID=CAMNT_0014114867 /DNA_START=100 /DNA_END=279 /DNA_ORIENTATION=+
MPPSSGTDSAVAAATAAAAATATATTAATAVLEGEIDSLRSDVGELKALMARLAGKLAP